MSSNKEIELRYQVHDVPALLGRLHDAGIAVVHTQHVIDEWFAPVKIKNLDEELAWFEGEKGVAWRIRTTEAAGVTKVIRDSKQLPPGDVTHTTFIESTPEVVDRQQAAAELARQGYRNWLTIDKTRYTLKATAAAPDVRDVAVTIDEIEGLAQKIGVGAVIEIEYTGPDMTFDETLAHLKTVAERLGFTDDERFEKSLTVAAKPALATF